MGECARCGAFTDNPAKGQYQYCEDCQQLFDEIRQNGVIVQQTPGSGGYEVYVTHESEEYSGGTESNQAEALARGKYIADDLGIEGLFEYEKAGSQWKLEEYLQEHPNVRQDVMQRLSRIPENTESGLLEKLRNLF